MKVIGAAYRGSYHLNCKNNKGFTALHEAVDLLAKGMESSKVITMLVEFGCDPYVLGM